MRTSALGLAAVLLAASMPFAARAALITHVRSLTVPDTSTGICTNKASIWQSAELLFPQFDPAMGTLTGIRIFFDVKLVTPAKLVWDNERDESRTGRYSIRTGYKVVGPHVTPSWHYYYAWNWYETLAQDSDGDPDFIGSDSLTQVTTTAGRMNKKAPGPSSFAGYQGTGTVALRFRKKTYSDYPDPEKKWNFALRFDHTGETTGTVSLRYEYVPEPTTLVSWAGLFGMGLIGLSWRGRKGK